MRMIIASRYGNENDFRLQIADFGFQTSDLGFEIWDLGFRISVFGFICNLNFVFWHLLSLFARCILPHNLLLNI